MNFIDGTSPLQLTSTPESSRLQSYNSFIKDAYAKGFITPYQEKLSKRSPHDWSRETWLERLTEFAKGEGEAKNLIPCYLFAVAVRNRKFNHF